MQCSRLPEVVDGRVIIFRRNDNNNGKIVFYVHIVSIAVIY